MSFLFAALAMSLTAHGGPYSSAKRPPTVKEVMKEEGFKPTLSQSAIYKPGTVLAPNDEGGHDVLSESCVDYKPRVSYMSESSIATTLAAGVTARLRVTRGTVDGRVEKRLSFVDPEQHNIPLSELIPSSRCDEELRTASKYYDISKSFVVYDVIVAIVKNTTCNRVDARGRVAALGEAEISLYSECVVQSDTQVPVGYKSQPLEKFYPEFFSKNEAKERKRPLFAPKAGYRGFSLEPFYTDPDFDDDNEDTLF